MYRKLYVDGCVDIVCNAVKVQSPDIRTTVSNNTGKLTWFLRSER